MRVLVISTHPDDETIGCGGTLSKHREAGDSLSWLIATRGWEPSWGSETIRDKAAEVEAVSKAYGFEIVQTLGLSAARLDTVPQMDLMAAIRSAIVEMRPDQIYMVHRGDVHSDHRAVFDATMSVLKPFIKGLTARRILSYECLSSTDAAPPNLNTAFVPNVFSDITGHIDEKIRTMELYRSEIQPDPLPRGPSAIRALARYRGATIGVAYAEAFMLVRELL